MYTLRDTPGYRKQVAMPYQAGVPWRLLQTPTPAAGAYAPGMTQRMLRMLPPAMPWGRFTTPKGSTPRHLGQWWLPDWLQYWLWGTSPSHAARWQREIEYGEDIYEPWQPWGMHGLGQWQALLPLAGEVAGIFGGKYERGGAGGGGGVPGGAMQIATQTATQTTVLTPVQTSNVQVNVGRDITSTMPAPSTGAYPPSLAELDPSLASGVTPVSTAGFVPSMRGEAGPLGMPLSTWALFGLGAAGIILLTPKPRQRSRGLRRRIVYQTRRRRRS